MHVMGYRIVTVRGRFRKAQDVSHDTALSEKNKKYSEKGKADRMDI